MTDNPVSHLADVSSFLAMEVFAKAEELENKGKNIIHLEFGEPDFPTPGIISEAAIQAINESQTRYTHTQGISSFREAVVDKYRRQYNLNISADQILTSSGSSILLYMAIRLLVPPGDDIIMTNICYACYNNLSIIAGVNPIRVDIHLEDNFELDVNAVKKAITPKTRAILINSPMNPTGTVLSKSCLKELASLGIPIISDEIYADLTYEGEINSILNYTDNCIVLNGLSKYYAMTGWRLGYMIINPAWVSVAAKVHQNMMISAAEFVQKAGAVAIAEAEGECAKMAKAFNERRKFVLKRLGECGLDPGYDPKGAFYVFLRYPKKGIDSLSLSMDILEKAGVAMTPGIDFGPGGEGFIRISYANSMEHLDTAITRLEKYFFG
ncbi:MAG: pyridoxal phosphate-dependent aminotransferase [Deltaproteobacteria bacterium]|jgi:(5-formylfuran-3-yl)methyl phosphate transaminase|nr:pyridoxal phosphate-dependent aminotransferase [Deltaproteobacteria bacterium]MBT4087662.1 pyridoxal phosphate-dependent aminotransferase [Deltaproteobacteria bacterium]MBT4265903.1 pyridoxal phosphate-dependent aminotransferase [Deltaproteobacteria bacterium]MBT4643675.1 pyridoxal phosphate-dependent aminotransferase [Deltaproteobacteria bacterium]MBT6503236.1 pyridoxal phosphate-dependent aminotransferase [Deltaproteobacteria bacterium]